MSDWQIDTDSLGFWRIQPVSGGRSPDAGFGPRYRGSFEDNEPSPRRLRIVFSSPRRDGDHLVSSLGLAHRFSAWPFPGATPREFAVSVEVNPDIWIREGLRRGWHFFSTSGKSVFLGLFSSLPATWLAQKPDGSPLPPPWTELWTFGSRHFWHARLWAVPGGRLDNPAEQFIEACLERGVPPMGSPKSRTVPVRVFSPGR